MSGLARSLADSLRLDEDCNAENDVVPNESAIPTTVDNDVVRRSESESSDKEKESVREIKRVNGLPVDKLQRAGSGSGSDSEGESGLDRGSGEVGFDWDWPSWKSVPQRYKLIGTTSLAFVICNMDKVNLSIAIIPMSHQFGWSSSEARLVQSSFFWGYTLSQLPGGWLSKIIGGRKVLEFGVLTWSLATTLVPLVAGFTPGLVLSRILVGIGEGVSPSAATDLIASWNVRAEMATLAFASLTSPPFSSLRKSLRPLQIMNAAASLSSIATVCFPNGHHCFRFSKPLLRSPSLQIMSQFSSSPSPSAASAAPVSSDPSLVAAS